MDVLTEARKGLPIHGVEVLDAHGHMGPYFNFHIAWNDADGMVEAMDRLGIRTTCVCPHAAIGPDVGLGNDMVMDAIDRHSGRFIGYIGTNPNYPEEVAPELERCAVHPGMRAIKLHPSLHMYPVNGPNWRPVWEWAQDRAWPVLIHTWMGDPYCNPELCAKTADDYPEANVLFAHVGGPTGTDVCIELTRTRQNVYLDPTASTNTFGLTERLVREVGAEKVIYGSDIPFIDAGVGLAKIVYAKIKDSEKELILGDTMRRLLKNGG